MRGWSVRRAILCTLFALIAQRAPGQTTDQQIVDRFFPQEILSQAQADDPDITPTKETAFVAADLNGTGNAEFLVAVYAAGEKSGTALARVLHKEKGSAVLVGGNCPDCSLFGEGPDIRPIDIDRSGRPTFLVETTSSLDGRPEEAIFRWNRTGLELMGPFGDARDCAFVDLDGDGTLEVTCPPNVSNSVRAQAQVASAYIVYKLSGGAYIKSDTILYVFQGYRVARNGHQDIEFAVADPGQPHVMMLSNGDGRDETPISGAEIRLNGALIAGPDRINAKLRTLRLPVTVAAHNTLSVKVTGDARSSIYVGIGPQHARR